MNTISVRPSTLTCFCNRRACRLSARPKGFSNVTMATNALMTRSPSQVNAQIRPSEGRVTHGADERQLVRGVLPHELQCYEHQQAAGGIACATQKCGGRSDSGRQSAVTTAEVIVRQAAAAEPPPPQASRLSSQMFPVKENASGILLGGSRPEHDDRHASDGHCTTDEIRRGWPGTVYNPQPQDRNTDIDATVSGVHASGGGWMQGEQPTRTGPGLQLQAQAARSVHPS